MSMDTPDTHLKYSHDNNKAYSGYEKSTVPAEDPELTHTDPGAPMGEFMRRFWQPVCMSEQLTEVPQAIKIMGEELVAFRDKSGQVGVLHRHCAHRGASLEYGIIQDIGIRCCYHGFHYAVDGTLLEVPGEADGGKRLAENLSQGAYPAFERHGLVFAYMGPYSEVPKFPEWDFFDTYEDLELVPYTNIYPCNYLQVFDNIPDQIHTSQLHSPHMRVISEDDDGGYPETALNPVFAQTPVMEYASVRNDTAMVFIAGRRVGTDKVWVRMNDVVVPNLTLHAYTFEDGRDIRYFHRVHHLRWYVPVDNENCVLIGCGCLAPPSIRLTPGAGSAVATTISISWKGRPATGRTRCATPARRLGGPREPAADRRARAGKPDAGGHRRLYESPQHAPGAQWREPARSASRLASASERWSTRLHLHPQYGPWRFPCRRAGTTTSSSARCARRCLKSWSKATSTTARNETPSSATR